MMEILIGLFLTLYVVGSIAIIVIFIKKNSKKKELLQEWKASSNLNKAGSQRSREVVNNGFQSSASIPRRRVDKASSDNCSYCRKATRPLARYTDGRGRILTVCQNCKMQAERQALVRL
jgi:hypothetical protein